MADEDATHRCITKFMLDICRFTQSEHAEVACLFCASVGIVGGASEVIPSGSSAELRIKPMLSCIGDFDIMITMCYALVIPQGHIPPTELPSHYQRTVYVYEIIDSHQPGYFYLTISSYKLTKTDNGRYVAENIEYDDEKSAFLKRYHFCVPIALRLQKATECFLRQYVNQEIPNNCSVQSLLTPAIEAHGPALNYIPCNEFLNNLKAGDKPGRTRSRISNLTVDLVICVHCPLWPPTAADWPTRSRNRGWPDQTTIDVVVSNGCDVVRAVHPLCRQDEWMNENQWRWSFSRAEVTLLNSWTKVQQVVYHMLRFVIKREMSKTNDNDPDLPTLSNYHLKTLMLWECEQRPQSWWSPESSLIKLCSWLLYKLCDWVEAKRCQHYFISNCNLLDYFVEDASMITCNNLRSLAHEPFLLSWFVENYVRKCAQCCPVEVSSLLEDACIWSSDKLERAVDAIVYWKLRTAMQDLCEDFYNSEKAALSFVMVYRSDATRAQTLTRELENFDPRLREYYVAVISLKIAYTLSIHSSLTEDLLEILWTLFDPCRPTAADSDIAVTGPHVYVRRAVKLATESSVRSNALEMLHNEISKAYLCRFSTNGQETIHCFVHILLAALYCKSGHYETAFDHCKQVLDQSDDEQCNLHSIGAEYLLQIDENVDSVIGLLMLYQYIQQGVLNPSIQHGNQQPEQASKPAFTIQLLADYLCTKWSPFSNSKRHKMTEYRQHLCCSEGPLLCDLLLFKESEIELIERTDMPTVSLSSKTTGDAKNASKSMDTSLLVIMLELVALEKLINVRQVMVDELHSERFPAVNEFEVLHAYKCGLFEECLEMCRNHVKIFLCAGCTQNQYYFVVMPEFLSMLDGELVSLFGVIRLLHPVLFLFLLQFIDTESISLLTLFVYLMVQCQKQLRSDLLCDTLQLIRFVHDEVLPADDKQYLLDRLILKLTYRSLKLHVDNSTFSDTCPVHCH